MIVSDSGFVRITSAIRRRPAAAMLRTSGAPESFTSTPDQRLTNEYGNDVFAVLV